MSTIDRSILRQLTTLAIASGLSLVLIMSFIKATGLIMLFASSGGSWRLLGELLLYSLPDMAALLLPLLSYGVVFWVYARMSDDRELAVMGACGMSPLRLARPALVFTAVMTLVAWAMTLWLVPLSYGGFKDREHAIRAGLASAILEPARFNPVGSNLSVYYAAGSPEGILEGVIIYDARNRHMKQTIVAERARMVREEDELTFILENGSLQRQTRGEPLPEIILFNQFTLAADAASLGYSSRNGRGINERSIDELLFGEPTTERERAELPKFRAHGHHQLATPLNCMALAGAALAMVLLGAPGRRGAPWWRWPAALAVGAGSQWIVLAATSLAEGNNALLPLIWVAVLLPGGVGWWLLARGRLRRRPPPARRRSKAMAAQSAGA